MTIPAELEELEAIASSSGTEGWGKRLYVQVECQKLLAICAAFRERHAELGRATMERGLAEQMEAAWKDSLAMAVSNTDYYRGLLEQIGRTLGPAAYTSDDGSVQQGVLCIKLPELVAQLLHDYDVARADAAEFRNGFARLGARAERLATAVAFFVSVARSGERWTEQCDQMLAEAKLPA